MIPLYISRLALRPGYRFKFQHKIISLAEKYSIAPGAITGRGLLRNLLIRAVALHTIAPGTQVILVRMGY